MKPKLTLFVAGSKELKEERMICRSVCNTLQNQWGTILTRTFEDFPETISTEGHKNEYNLFIRDEADVVLFIFSGKVGTITISEFRHAYQSFTQNGHPKILVYIDTQQANSPEITDLKNSLAQQGQYYKEYHDLEELERMVDKHLTRILIEQTKNREQPGKLSPVMKVLGISAWIVGIWCFLAVCGGIGMYIHDRNMSDQKCASLATKYMESGRDGELLYYFPDETFIYNQASETVDVLARKNTSSTSDLSIAKLEHVTFGATASILLARLMKFKAKGNAKTMLGYAAAVAAGAIGFGVGCVIEQMLFPPQYSQPMKEYLSNAANWEHAVDQHQQTHWF